MRTQWLAKWLRLRPTSALPQPTLAHFTREVDGMMTRFHLRVDPDGGGVLIANASAACRLSPTGVLMARRLLDGNSEANIVAEMSRTFRQATRAQVEADLGEVRSLIDRLAEPGDNYPILNFDERSIGSALTAPLRADVTMASAEQLLRLLDRLWDMGIPQVTFRFAEGDNVAELVRLVERAEDLGMIAGVQGRATDFGSAKTVQDLALAGADHLTFLFAWPAETHDSLLGAGDHERALASFAEAHNKEVCPVAIVPLLAATAPHLEETMAVADQHGVRNLSFFAVATTGDSSEAVAADSLLPLFARIEHAAGQADVRFLWEPPVLRATDERLDAQVRRGPRAAGDAAIRVEPDGAVIPPRGPWKAAGNLLSQDWQQISGTAAFKASREAAAKAVLDVSSPEVWSNDEGRASGVRL